MLKHSRNDIDLHDKNQYTHDFINTLAKTLSERIESTKILLQIIKTLSKYKINTSDDIEIIKCENAKNFLKKNKYITYTIIHIVSEKVSEAYRYAQNIIFEAFYSDTSEQWALEYTTSILSHYSKTRKYCDHSEIEKFAQENNIEKPTVQEIKEVQKQLNIMIWHNLIGMRPSEKNLLNAVENDLLLKNRSTSQSFAESFFYITELRNTKRTAYISSVESKQKTTELYQITTQFLKESIKLNSQLLDSITEALRKKQGYLGQATYHNLFNGIRTKQKGKILELNTRHEEQALLINLIMNDNYLSQSQKLEVLNNIKNEDLGYEIDRWLGKTLTKQERRILRVLRRIIYQMIELEEITGIGKSIYEAEIPLSKIYEEYGLEKRKCGSYDHNQTKIIQDILFNSSTKGLHEDILFKHTYIQKTRFILQIEELKQKVIINKERGGVIEPCEVEQRIGIRIVMPHFLFVSDLNPKGYYYQDTEGFKNFIAIKGMSQSDPAFNIAEYLEWFLSNKLKERSLNQSTLVEEGGVGLQNRYKTHKGEVLRTIETILNNMVKARYLIKEWHLDKGKYGQAQYIFKNLRYELFTAGKSKCDVIKLPISRTTKRRNNNSSLQLIVP